MHGRKGRKLTKFEEVLMKYEPMISASLRKLNIYQNHESFRQAGRVALWQAWTRYKEDMGHFAPYAYRSIQGGMLDELKKESRVKENVMQMEDEKLNRLREIEVSAGEEIWSDRLASAFGQLTVAERTLIKWLFVEGHTQMYCAEKAGDFGRGDKKEARANAREITSHFRGGGK